MHTDRLSVSRNFLWVAVGGQTCTELCSKVKHSAMQNKRKSPTVYWGKKERLWKICSKESTLILCGMTLSTTLLTCWVTLSTTLLACGVQYIGHCMETPSEHGQFQNLIPGRLCPWAQVISSFRPLSLLVAFSPAGWGIFQSSASSSQAKL